MDTGIIQHQHRNIIKDVLKSHNLDRKAKQNNPYYRPKKLNTNLEVESDDEMEDADSGKGKSNKIEIQYLGNKIWNYRFSLLKNKFSEAPPSLVTENIKHRMETRFQQILNVYDKVILFSCPGQKKFISPDYIVYQCAKAESLDKLCEFFSLPKTATTLAKYDKIWQRICLDCQWKN